MNFVLVLPPGAAAAIFFMRAAVVTINSELKPKVKFGLTARILALGNGNELLNVGEFLGLKPQFRVLSQLRNAKRVIPWRANGLCSYLLLAVDGVRVDRFRLVTCKITAVLTLLYGVNH